MSSKIHIRLAKDRVDSYIGGNGRHRAIYSPGEIITPVEKFIRGHGTYEHDDYLIASVAGTKEQLNNLVSIWPVNSRYIGHVGDVVIGVITDVQSKRWKVDVNSYVDANLPITSINLPSGELRIRSLEDEQKMRKYLGEGQYISAEVRRVELDGTLILHTRNIHYGKLDGGIFVKISPLLIQRSKTHFLDFLIDVSVILGSNGYIWIYSNIFLEKKVDCKRKKKKKQKIIRKQLCPERESMARVRNCILALAASNALVYDTSIWYAYEESIKYTVPELLLPETMFDIVILVQQRLNMLQDD